MGVYPVASVRRGEVWCLQVEPFRAEVVVTSTFAQLKGGIGIKEAIYAPG